MKYDFHVSGEGAEAMEKAPTHWGGSEGCVSSGTAAAGCTFLCVPQGEGWQGQCLANGGEAKAAFVPAALRWVSVWGMYTDNTVIKKHPFFFSLDTKCPAELTALPKTHSNIHLRFSSWCTGRYTDVRFLSSFIQEIFQVISNTDEQNNILRKGFSSSRTLTSWYILMVSVLLQE